MTVRGGDFPIPESKAQLASFIMYTQLGAIAAIAALPDMYLPAIVVGNKFSSGIIVWIIGNAVSSGIKNSGAFEIFKGDVLIWSTLEKGHLPTFPELVTVFGAAGIDLNRR